MIRFALALLLLAGCVRVPDVQPRPDPPPDPDVVVPVPPVVAGSLHVLIWRETDQPRIPEGHLRQFYGPEVVGWLQKNAKFHIWDVDVVLDANQAPVWRKLAEKRPDRSKLPVIVVDDGKDRFEGPLPATPEETIALLERYKR